ncbi:MAG: DUF692 domain-containing protein [Xanthomonadales bacterium]|jgi:hypothetical protein|nr:DUF692 domain-containing protein [Xanthomonadales bacterium]
MDLSRCGLGLRRPMLDELRAMPAGRVGFLELAPDNWIGVGGRRRVALDELASRFPIYAHGLSLSLGGPEPFDRDYLAKLRQFLDALGCPLYSEHLSYCSDEGQLYDLLPLPFTDEAVRHVAARIGEVQDALGRRIAIENVSYYAAPHQAMTEIDFVRAVLAEADCGLLLDVNNIHVNSINHGYDPLEFLHALPAERVVAMHVAGHYVEAPDLIVDTHGAAVLDPVWRLLDAAYAHCGVHPTLLERDFNFPPLAELLAEVDRIAAIQARHPARSAPRRHAFAAPADACSA